MTTPINTIDGRGNFREARQQSGWQWKFTIDFSKDDIRKQYVSPEALGMRNLSVQIQTVKATAIAGSWTAKQTNDKQGGAGVFDFTVAKTQAAAVNGNAVILGCDLELSYLVLGLPATLPSEGKAIITVTAKAHS